MKWWQNESPFVQVQIENDENGIIMDNDQLTSTIYKLKYNYKKNYTSAQLCFPDYNLIHKMLPSIITSNL